MELHTLKPAAGSIKKPKRLGRGEASGKGGTSTKGNKGQQSRSGYKTKIGHEGGQMPIQRRLPKRGFKSLNKTSYKIFNLGQLDELITKYQLEEVSLESLRNSGLIRRNDRVKILSEGELKAKINFKVNAVSEKAREALEAAGSKVELV
jgi:large subunit ribosomal protein L15